MLAEKIISKINIKDALRFSFWKVVIAPKPNTTILSDTLNSHFTVSYMLHFRLLDLTDFVKNAIVDIGRHNEVY